MTSTSPPKPLLTTRPGGYELTWAEWQVSLRLDRIREHTDTLTAEVGVFDTAVDPPGCIHGADRLNLLSEIGRKKLANTLQPVVLLQNKPLPWVDMLKQACRLVVAQYRAGEPVVEVGALPEDDAPRWRLWPLLPEGKTAILYGEKGVLKSHLAVLCGLCVQYGKGKELRLQPLQGNVLYLDWETTRREIDRLCKAIGKVLGVPNPILHYRRCYRSIPEDMEEIEAAVRSNKIDLLIIDSAIPASGSEDAAKNEAARMLNCVRGLGPTVLLVAHVTKDPKGRHNTPYGSYAFTTLSRHLWEVRKAEGPEEEDWVGVGLYNTWTNEGRKLHPLGLRFSWNSHGLAGLEPQDVKALPELRQGLSHTAQIQVALERTARPVTEIAEMTGIPLKTVRSRLTDGKKIGIFVQIGSGVWGKAGHEEV